jgi:septal ring factor EnvC (AmiA/AmiB activator)
MNVEKVMEWVFKVTAALVIPTLAWTFSVSKDLALLEERIRNHNTRLSSVEKSSGELAEEKTKIAVHTAVIESIRTDLNRTTTNLDRIVERLNRLLERRP